MVCWSVNLTIRRMVFTTLHCSVGFQLLFLLLEGLHLQALQCHHGQWQWPVVQTQQWDLLSSIAVTGALPAACFIRVFNQLHRLYAIQL